jgi:multiple sugar transport system substrate-binding protein
MDTVYAPALHKLRVSRRTAALSTVAAAGPVLACARAQAPQPASSQESASLQPATISYLGRGSTNEEEVYRTLIALFEEKHPSTKVRIGWAGTGGAAQIWEKLQTMVAGGIPPDTFWVHSYSTADLAANELLLPLAQFFSKDKSFDLAAYYKAPLEGMSYQQTVVALPRETSSKVMFYNRNLLERAGLAPFDKEWTWDDWLAAARRLTSGEGTERVWGTAAPVSAFDVITMIWQNGGEAVDASRTRSLFDSREAIETVQWIADLRFKERVAPTPADYAGSSLNDLFKSARLATFASNQALAIDLLRSNVAFPWDVVPVPKRKVKAYGEASSGHGVYKGTKYPEHGWRLVRYLADEEAARVFARSGLVIPAFRRVTESDVFPGTQMPPSYNRVWIEVLTSARSMPVTRNWLKVISEIERTLAPVWSGELPAVEGCRNAKQAVDQALAEVRGRA